MGDSQGESFARPVEPVDLSGGSTPQLGDFRILRRVGRGGMGIIYEAIQVSLDRRVALKTLPAGLLVDPKARVRFEREARAAARLHHPNIVEIYSTGIEQDTPYYAMEFVDGVTLRDLPEMLPGRDDLETPPLIQGLSTSMLALSAWWSGSERAVGVGGTFQPALAEDSASLPDDSRSLRRDGSSSSVTRLQDFRRIAESFAEVADGLQHAHSLGIIHRDVKPSNLILDRGGDSGPALRGRLRLLDFGLAWVEGQEHLTVAEEAVGTPAYMSPEQAQPGLRVVGPATDVYGLGVTLYEVLTGGPPFEGKNVHQTLALIVSRDPIPPRGLNPAVPRDLETIVLKCLRKSPRDRYGTAEALAQDLRRFARGDPIEARHYTGFERLARRAWRHRGKLAVAAVMTLLLAGVAWFGLEYARESRRLRDGRYRSLLVEVATRIHEAFVPRAARLGDGRYSGGVYVPTGTVIADPSDFEAALRKAAADPLKESLARIEEAAGLFPARPDAHFYAARVLERQRRYAQALLRLRPLVERSPPFPPALLLRSAILKKLGDPEGAEATAERATLSSDSVWARAWLQAEESMAMGSWREAVEAFDTLSRLETTAKEPYVGALIDISLGHGVALLELGKVAGASEEFAWATGRWPDFPDPMLLLGRAQLVAGAVERARSTFEKLYRESEETKDAIALRIAEIFCSLGRIQDALDWAGRISDPGLRARCQAPLHIRTGELEEALDDAAWAIRHRPRDSLAHLWKGLALLAGGADLEGAEAALSDAKRLDPENPMAAVWLGDVLAKRGKLPEAIEEYRHAVRLDPENSWARISRGVTLERKGQHAEALDSYLFALELDPRLAAAYQHMDGLLRREDCPDLEPFRDRFVRALRAVLSTSGQHPLVPDFLRLVSLSLAESSRESHVSRAVEYARLACEKTSWTAPRMLAALANALAASGDRRGAVLTLEEAQRLPRATRQDLEALPVHRQSLLPEIPSCSSADATLAASDLDEILPEGATWSYFPGRSDPSEGGVLWYAPDFDDSAWKRGPSGFGYGDNDDRTELSDMQWSYSSVHVRAGFSIGDIGDGLRTVLCVRADDGFAAWLNGVEVGRWGVHPEKTPLPYDATADVISAEPPLPVEIVLEAPPLRVGRNVLAIQGLNASLDSSDLSLIPVLRRERPPDPDRDAAIVRAFRESGADPSLPLAYLEGRVLQRAGRLAQAAARFRDALALARRERSPNGKEAAPDPLPTIRLVECLRDSGELAVAESTARAALGTELAGDRLLWELWTDIVLRDLGLSPAEALATVPRPLRRATAASGACPAEDAAWILGRLAARQPIRIQCGGGDLLDSDGRDWGRDRFYSGGCRYGEDLWSPFREEAPPPYGGEIGGTADDLLYQTERWFPAEEASVWGYRIPLLNGRYRVALLFAEVFYRESGKRAFDVLVEGRAVLRWYSPPVASPPSPDVQRFEADVGDGFLDLEFRPQVEFPKISAIEVTRID